MRVRGSRQSHINAVPKKYSNSQIRRNRKNYKIVLTTKDKTSDSRKKENFLIKAEGISDFILRLRKGAEFCQFSKLKESTDPTEDMITMSLIAGLHDSESKKRLLEKIGHSEPSVDEIKEFVQNMEQLKSFINKNATLAESEEDNKELHYIRREQKSITKCKFCGSDHARGKCPAFGKKCLNCSKPNHFAIVCLSAQNKQSKQVNSVIESSTELDIGSIFVVNSCHKELVSCLINSNKIQMQIDTGADVSIISSKLWKDLGEPKLKHHNMKLTAYDGHIMKCLGYFTAEVETEKRIHAIKLTVIESEKSYGLLGQDIIEDTKTINSATAKNKSSDFLPVIRGVQAKMELLKDANNFFCRARPVPLALESKVNAELLRLEEMGIISPCRDPVANCSPVVWIKKDNGELRMCVDFKVHVNRKIKTETYPLPNIETIFARMKNAKRFAKIDLKSAYWQIELDNNARQLSIINTSKGLFYVNRLQLGMKNSSSIFQRTMEDILADIKGILIYQDDILVFGENDEALKND